MDSSSSLGVEDTAFVSFIAAPPCSSLYGTASSQFPGPRNEGSPAAPLSEATGSTDRSKRGTTRLVSRN